MSGYDHDNSHTLRSQQAVTPAAPSVGGLMVSINRVTELRTWHWCMILNRILSLYIEQCTNLYL